MKVDEIRENLNYLCGFYRSDIASVSEILERRHNATLFGTKDSFMRNSEKAWRLRQTGMSYQQIAKCMKKHPSTVSVWVRTQKRIHAS